MEASSVQLSNTANLELYRSTYKQIFFFRFFSINTYMYCKMCFTSFLNNIFFL